MKRSNGTGNIVKLPGNRRKPWAIRVSVYEDGERKRKILGTFSTRRDAQKKLDELMLTGEPYSTPRAPKRLVLRDCVDLALERAEETLKARSVIQYRTDSKHLGFLLDLPVSSLTGEIIQSRFDELCDSGLSRPVITTTMIVLKKAVKVAQRKNALFADPTAGVEIGKRVKAKPKARRPFTHAEIMRLQEMDDPMAKTVLLMIYTGMRLAEFCQCRKYLNGFLYVEESKTASGIRVVPVADWLRPLVEERMKQGSLLGKPLVPRYFFRVFKDWCKENGFDHIPHETRHTFATLLDEARLPDGHRIDIAVTKVLLGHRVSDITKGTYTHENAGRLVEAVNALENAWVTGGQQIRTKSL